MTSHRSLPVLVLVFSIITTKEVLNLRKIFLDERKNRRVAKLREREDFNEQYLTSFFLLEDEGDEVDEDDEEDEDEDRIEDQRMRNLIRSLVRP
ncbi:hypothetical protein M0802_009500 [Mischocyttarus mexicanus]|nr:hypothetical protein M0802_009500 [Mischocyttarus mexicanus]